MDEESSDVMDDYIALRVITGRDNYDVFVVDSLPPGQDVESEDYILVPTQDVEDRNG